MVRTIAIWVFGLLASAIIGGLVGECFGVIFTTARLSREISGNAALSHANTPEMVWSLMSTSPTEMLGGALAGMCVFACARLWWGEPSRNSK
jgi:hypothetical protein